MKSTPSLHAPGLIKVISDQGDYWRQFVYAITISKETVKEKKLTRPALRPADAKRKGKFNLRMDGISEVGNRHSLHGPGTGEGKYPGKEFYSKHNSFTYVDASERDPFWAPVFEERVVRKEDDDYDLFMLLYKSRYRDNPPTMSGIWLTPPSDNNIVGEQARLQRVFKYNEKSFDRWYDCPTKEAAEKLLEEKTVFLSFSELKSAGFDGLLNEAMIRARWNSGSRLCIMSDTLRARLLTQIWANDLQRRLLAQAQENAELEPKEMDVPISFYLPDANKNFTNPENKGVVKWYTAEDQKQDRETKDRDPVVCLYQRFLELMGDAHLNKAYSNLFNPSSPKELTDLLTLASRLSHHSSYLFIKTYILSNPNVFIGLNKENWQICLKCLPPATESPELFFNKAQELKDFDHMIKESLKSENHYEYLNKLIQFFKNTNRDYLSDGLRALVGEKQDLMSLLRSFFESQYEQNNEIKGHCAKLYALINSGIDCNKEDKFKKTPLEYMLIRLSELKIINKKNKYLSDEYYYFTQKLTNAESIIDVLIKNGANFTQLKKENFLLIINYFFKNRDFNKLKLALEHAGKIGISLNQQNEAINDILNVVANKGDSIMLNWLIKCGVILDLKNTQLLRSAVDDGHIEIVRLLLAYGIEPEIKKAVLAIAKRKAIARTEIINLLGEAVEPDRFEFKMANKHEHISKIVEASSLEQLKFWCAESKNDKGQALKKVITAMLNEDHGSDKPVNNLLVKMVYYLINEGVSLDTNWFYSVCEQYPATAIQPLFHHLIVKHEFEELKLSKEKDNDSKKILKYIAQQNNNDKLDALLDTIKFTLFPKCDYSYLKDYTLFSSYYTLISGIRVKTSKTFFEIEQAIFDKKAKNNNRVKPDDTKPFLFASLKKEIALIDKKFISSLAEEKLEYWGNLIELINMMDIIVGFKERSKYCYNMEIFIKNIQQTIQEMKSEDSVKEERLEICHSLQEICSQYVISQWFAEKKEYTQNFSQKIVEINFKFMDSLNQDVDLNRLKEMWKPLIKLILMMDQIILDRESHYKQISSILYDTRMLIFDMKPSVRKDRLLNECVSLGSEFRQFIYHCNWFGDDNLPNTFHSEVVRQKISEEPISRQAQVPIMPGDNKSIPSKSDDSRGSPLVAVSICSAKVSSFSSGPAENPARQKTFG